MRGGGWLIRPIRYRAVRALLVCNSHDADPGFVGERFRHHGYSFAECHRERPDDWPSLAGIDLVLALGSDWSVYWPHVGESVEAEAELIRAAHHTGIPVFGICYGNQIMAHALGGTVERGRELEIGWYDVVSDIPEVIAPGPWFEWHGDIVTVPGAAIELARTSVGPQAWRLARSFSTQFHPEATESIVRRWIRTGGEQEAIEFGHDPEALVSSMRDHLDDSRPNAERIVDWFLDSVATSECP